MADELLLDRIEESEAVEDAQGVRIVRTAFFYVDAAAGNIDPSAMLAYALTSTKLPAYGSGHPAYGAATLRTKRVVPWDANSPNEFKVVMSHEWQRPNLGAPGGDPTQPGGGSSGALLEVKTQLMSEPWNFDVYGDATMVVYSPARDNSAATRRIADVSRLVPMLVAQITRTEASSPSLEEYLKVGCVNDRFWQGFKRWFWLYSGLESTFQPQSGTFLVTRQCTNRIYRPWLECGIYLDEQGARPHQMDPMLSIADLRDTDKIDLDEVHNGWQLFRMQPEGNFKSIFPWI